MSMIMRIARGSDSELEALAAGGDSEAGSASRLSARLAAISKLPPETRQQMVAVLQSNPRRGALSPQVLAGLRRGLTVVPAGNGAGSSEAEVKEPEAIDLHKSWHVFHYLFTGTAGGGASAPGNFMLEGGRETGEDQGYGPARLFSAAQTAAIAAFVGRLSVGDVTDRIDAPNMAAQGVYCAGDGSPADVEEMSEDVKHFYPKLQAHFLAAASEGQSTLLMLT